MSTCDSWARFHEGDVQFDVECDLDLSHLDPALDSRSLTHHDPVLGKWDRVVGLYDRSLTPTESRLKR